ncbi:MAG: hypothetical protein IT273_03225 [Chitinophagales bacterium]|nr:hypothetical protein [Chitinophagales bacterium]
MNKTFYIICLFVAISFTACGQSSQSLTTKNQAITANDMDLSKITNEAVKKAIEALQANDKNAWYAYFTNDALFTDDGRTMNFKSFFDNAFEKKEKFLSIDKIENEGQDIYGNFYAGQWGTFKVFFKFHLNAEGKINRLDIGQTNY